MSSYIGVRCPVCNKKFAQADDIVVCPVCGAPHHRGCYAEKGECVFAADHMLGREWRPPAPEPREMADGDRNEPSDTAACPACKAPNPKSAFFCQICGRPMPYREGQNPSPPNAGPWGFPGFGGFGGGIDQSAFIYGGISPDDKIDDIPARDLALYVGENSAYYLAHFKRMDESPSAISFNFASLLFGFFYFFYRKMYVVGGVLLALSAVSAIPGILQLREYLPQLLYLYNLVPSATVDSALLEQYQWLVNITSTINLFISIAVSLFANKLYFTKAVRDVKNIRQSRSNPPDERAYAEALTQKGGVGRTLVISVVCAIAVAYCACCVVLINQYMGVL